MSVVRTSTGTLQRSDDEEYSVAGLNQILGADTYFYPQGSGVQEVAPSSVWSPEMLGAKLRGWWNADRSDLMTLAVSAVSSWRDVVAGYDAAQAVSANRPVYSATSYNGAPGVSFDGIQSFLAMASNPFQTGSQAGDIWANVQQDALVADSGVRRIIAFGTNNNNDTRFMARTVGGGVNRASVNTGLGGSAIAKNDMASDLSGRHVVRGIWTATTIDVEVDGVTAGGATAAVSATGSTLLNIGRGTNGTGYWWGQIRDIIVTDALTTEEAFQLQSFLQNRRRP